MQAHILDPALRRTSIHAQSLSQTDCCYVWHCTPGCIPAGTVHFLPVDVATRRVCETPTGPGRLDREVQLTVPSEADRHAIIAHYMKNTPTDDDVDLIDVVSARHSL